MTKFILSLHQIVLYLKVLNLIELEKKMILFNSVKLILNRIVMKKLTLELILWTFHCVIMNKQQKQMLKNKRNHTCTAVRRILVPCYMGLPEIPRNLNIFPYFHILPHIFQNLTNLEKLVIQRNFQITTTCFKSK